MILVGDIGGTKTVLALFEQTAEGLRETRSTIWSSAAYSGLEAVVEEFFRGDDAVRLDAACFAIAGPVRGGRVRTTNLPWIVDAQGLAAAIGAPRVVLLNDLQAAAYGMLFQAPGAFEVLNGGAPEDQERNIAVLAPGTGLGEAMLYWDGRRYHPLASEGGHADFAPRTDRQIELLRYLRTRTSAHVSYERVLRGNGLQDLYRFVRDSGRQGEPSWLAEALLQSGDPNAAITEIGLAGKHPLCVEALDLFVSILGAAAGNLALRCLAGGGIILGGGIPPKILPALRTDRFMAAFSDKGRFSDWMRGIPVRVALDPLSALLGAAHFLNDTAAIDGVNRA